jgi:hypothetical protein
MSFGFRVCFLLPSKGSLTSDEEFIPFEARQLALTLKLSSGTAGVSLGKNDRFSISGDSFETAEDAQAVAEKVRIALLRRAIVTHRGIDLGQHITKSFGITDYGKQYIAELLKVDSVQEDHLGITVYRDDPRPKFVRMNATALVSSHAQIMVDDLSSSIGRYGFASPKAEVASALYAISPFVGLPPARFLLLFVSFESLFEPTLRSDEAQAHVQSLIEATQQAPISPADRTSICSSLSFLRSQSIGQTGRDLARNLLSGQTYDGMDAPAFFSRIYEMRNDIVHKGHIDVAALQASLGELDRFVSDVLRHYYVEF